MKLVLLLSGLFFVNAYAMQDASSQEPMKNFSELTKAEQAKKAMASMREYEIITKEKNAQRSGGWRDAKSERMLELLERIEKNQEALATKQTELEKKLQKVTDIVTMHAFADTQVHVFSSSVRALLTLVYNRPPQSNDAAEYKRLLLEDYNEFKRQLKQLENNHQ